MKINGIDTTAIDKPFGELSEAEQGALLLAHLRGAEFEAEAPGPGLKLGSYPGEPNWLSHYTYRVKPEPKTPDSIDWSLVPPEVSCIARNEDNLVRGFNRDPLVGMSVWHHSFSDHFFTPTTIHDDNYNYTFPSYQQGTVDWKDSLLRRPE